MVILAITDPNVPRAASRFANWVSGLIRSLTNKSKPMTTSEIVRSWKDEDYRASLPVAEQEQVPPNPAGLVEFGVPQLGDESLFGPEAKKCKFFTHTTHGKKCGL